MTMQVKEQVVPAYCTPLGIQQGELWTGRQVKINGYSLNEGITDLMRTNLSTQESHCLQLNKATCFNRTWNYYTSVAFSKDSIFVPRFMMIDIFDIHTGDFMRTLSTGKIMGLKCEENFLYVLCSEEGGLDELLQYDLLDLFAPPKQLNLPSNITGNNIYYGKDELLIIQENRLYMVLRKDCFTDKEAAFRSYTIPKENSFSLKIKETNDGFFMMVKDPDSPDKSSIVQKLNIAEFTAHKIATLPFPLSDISDFYITNTSIYTSSSSDIEATCYNIEKGTVEKFKSDQNYDVTLTSRFVSPEPGVLQLISQAYKETELMDILTLDIRT